MTLRYYCRRLARLGCQCLIPVLYRAIVRGEAIHLYCRSCGSRYHGIFAFPRPSQIVLSSSETFPVFHALYLIRTSPVVPRCPHLNPYLCQYFPRRGAPLSASRRQIGQRWANPRRVSKLLAPTETRQGLRQGLDPGILVTTGSRVATFCTRCSVDRNYRR